MRILNFSPPSHDQTTPQLLQIKVLAAGPLLIIYPLPFFFMYCVVDSSDGCDGEKCHMYASCKVKPDTGKKECECQFGFTGNGVDCKGY